MIRKMSPEQAVEILQFTRRSGAEDLLKAIKTAVANSKGEGRLSFKSIEINEGLKMKRYMVGTAGRGRGRPFKRRFSHIKVVLTDEIMNDEVKKIRKENKSGTKD